MDVLVENLPLGLVSYQWNEATRELQLVRANAAAGRILGRDFSALIGEPLLALFPDVAETEIPEMYERIAKEGGLEKVTGEQFRDSFYDSVTFQSGANQVTIVFSDVTEAMQQKQELEQFAYVVSHDLQAPLRHISSFIGLLKEKDLNLDEQSQKWFSHVENAADNMRHLIRDMLSLARIKPSPTEPEIVDLNQLANRVSDELRAGGGDLLLECAALPKVWGHPGHLHRLFQNIFENASRYRKPDQDARVHVSAVRNIQSVTLRFSDNGIGIAPKHHDTIFRIFQRLNPQQVQGSTGIGLAACKKIAQLHGGDIRVESEEDSGATFVVTLRSPSI